MNYLLVGLGGALGAILRFALARLSIRLLPLDFPYTILAINVAGSLAMGVVVGYGARHAMSEEARLFVMVGVLGGFTTFSSFSLDAIALFQRGQTVQAALYIGLSVGLALLGLMAGLLVMRAA